MQARTDHLGIGVFESFLLRVSAPGQFDVIALDRHIGRLQHSAGALGLSWPSASEIKTALLEQLRHSNPDHIGAFIGRCVLRVGEFSVSVEPWRATLDSTAGIAAALHRAQRPLPQHKSCSAIVSHLARDEANRRGFAEALLVDDSGFVREGAWSNFFILQQDRTLITPAQRILPGITRQIVLELASQLTLKIEQRDVGVPELFSNNAEVFITQATHGVVPVVTIEQQSVGLGGAGPITRSLQQMYRDYPTEALKVVA